MIKRLTLFVLVVVLFSITFQASIHQTEAQQSQQFIDYRTQLALNLPPEWNARSYLDFIELRSDGRTIRITVFPATTESLQTLDDFRTHLAATSEFAEVLFQEDDAPLATVGNDERRMLRVDSPSDGRILYADFYFQLDSYPIAVRAQQRRTEDPEVYYEIAETILLTARFVEDASAVAVSLSGPILNPFPDVLWALAFSATDLTNNDALAPINLYIASDDRVFLRDGWHIYAFDADGNLLATYLMDAVGRRGPEPFMVSQNNIVIRVGDALLVQQLDTGEIINEIDVATLLEDDDNQFPGCIICTQFFEDNGGIWITHFDTRGRPVVIHMSHEGNVLSTHLLTEEPVFAPAYFDKNGHVVLVTREDETWTFDRDGALVSQQTSRPADSLAEYTLDSELLGEPAIQLSESIDLEIRTISLPDNEPTRNPIIVRTEQRLWQRFGRFGNGDLLLMLSNLNNDNLLFNSADTTTLLMRISQN